MPSQFEEYPVESLKSMGEGLRRSSFSEALHHDEFCFRPTAGNLPFEDWTSVFGSERLTGALLDRLTHHVHILEMNGDSYRLKQSKFRRRKAAKSMADEALAAEIVDPDTGEITTL